jgi:hypothetical protein
MTRKIPLTVFAAVQCVVAGLAATSSAQAATASIPDYFFSQWTVKSNCTEANAGPAVKVQAGLQFKISQQAAAGAPYTFETIDAAGKQWATEWSGLELQYRSGTKMTTVPADFECVAGAETSSASSSSLLAMSGYVQTAEPQFAQEHWYGLANIRGQWEHVLIFPLNTKGNTSAVIVMESATADSNVTLDEGGVINAD